jgi:hypothetical protein
MSDLDYYELALFILGLGDNASDDEIEGAIYDKFEVDGSQFRKIAGKLMDYAHIAESPLSGSINVGFADHSSGRFITMKEYEPSKK